MQGHAIVVAVTVLYFVIMIVIGFWANKRMKSAKDFLVAGQSLGFFVMAIATFSSIQSGWGMVGSSGTTYAWGMQTLIMGAGSVGLGFCMSWFLLGKRLQKLAEKYEVYSVPDYIKIRYGSRAAHIVMSIAMLLGSVGYMTSQITALGLIMGLLFGIPFITGAWIGAIIVAVYTVAGGMLAAVWTDLIQGVMMVVVSIVIFGTAVSGAGGWSNMLDTLGVNNLQYVSILGVMPITWLLANMIMITFGIAGQPHMITKFLMLRDSKQLKWGVLVCSVAYAVTTLFSIGVGLAMRAYVIKGTIPALKNVDSAATEYLGNADLVHPMIAGIALAGLLAAIMSSASSYITIGASSIMRDLASAFNITVKRELFWGRIYSVVVVLLSILFGLYLDQIIFILGAFGWAAFAGATFGPIVLSLYWRRATGIATTISISVGLLFNLIATILTAKGFFSLPKYLAVGGVSVVLGIVLFILISYVTRSVKDEEKFDQLFAGGEQ
jgi:sodium/proline symporter